MPESDTSATTAFRPAAPVSREDFSWQLPAETITVRIRWFGLCVGYVLVNVVGPNPNQPELNAILTLGAVYALIDTVWSLRGKVFLSRAPLFISLMEAVFIGLLCHFDDGLDSLFRFYYFLSLLVCAIRYSPRVTYATFAVHAVSYSLLAISQDPPQTAAVKALLLMLIIMGWVTWASTALVTLLKAAGRRLSELNDELQRNQALLEERIAERTRELQESQALLLQQEKQAAFGLLAAGIAHEVGNPLAAISSLVQMMNRRELDDYMHERLGMVDDQLRRIQRTLRELVGFSRPASKNVTSCDIHEVIDEALNVAKYYKRKKGKQIVTHYTDGAPCVAVVRDQMVQVFLNLVLNALDATEEGGTIDITTCVADGSLEIVVRDDGHGIAGSDQTRLFEPYFTTKPTGTGLGLFVCRSIVEAAGGQIELQASSPEGTSFQVLLPVIGRLDAVGSGSASAAGAVTSEPAAASDGDAVVVATAGVR
jgi:signal transduction histidine kinase